MPTLERTNPVENPQRTTFFLLVTFKSRMLSATHVGLKFTYGFEVGV